jgi:hypothetical protein
MTVWEQAAKSMEHVLLIFGGGCVLLLDLVLCPVLSAGRLLPASFFLDTELTTVNDFIHYHYKSAL